MWAGHREDRRLHAYDLHLRQLFLLLLRGATQWRRGASVPDSPTSQLHPGRPMADRTHRVLVRKPFLHFAAGSTAVLTPSQTSSTSEVAMDSVLQPDSVPSLAAVLIRAGRDSYRHHYRICPAPLDPSPLSLPLWEQQSRTIAQLESPITSRVLHHNADSHPVLPSVLHRQPDPDRPLDPARGGHQDSASPE